MSGTAPSSVSQEQSARVPWPSRSLTDGWTSSSERPSRERSANEPEADEPGGALRRLELVRAADAEVAPGAAGDRPGPAHGPVDRPGVALRLESPVPQVEGAGALGAAVEQVAGVRGARGLGRPDGPAVAREVVLLEHQVARRAAGRARVDDRELLGLDLNG